MVELVSTNDEEIIPTYVWYYYICRREVWLMSHHVKPNEDDKNVEIGRVLHENSYVRNKKEISLPGMKLDVVTTEDGQTVVGEIKKSSRSLKAARMQLLYYLYKLRENKVDAKGRLYFPREKKTLDVNLDSASITEIEDAIYEIRNIIRRPTPPKPEKIRFCRNCAYRELCWS